ncbi:hypothetical protein [Streptomyces odontomachi]|uniref:hypothetical protein n=1 Tax=Streptomyces odontomachi TaxID=2944940 RepID=UPI002108D771|nr:hypothetical protein [Streptomyces sp. ODS25]
MGWRRQQMVRSALVGGTLLLVLIVMLSMCGTTPSDSTGADDHGSGPRPRFAVPAGYDTAHGWDAHQVSDAFAVAPTTGSIAALEGAGRDRIRLRALDVTTGRTRWTGEARKAPSDSWTHPRLLEVAKGGREFFVVWSYGDVSTSVLGGAEKVVALDVYDAAYGTRRHVEVPWNEPPDVAGGGPGILIGRGGDHAAVVDPTDGAATKIAAKDLKYPKGCTDCRRNTEIRGLTTHGLVVRGARQFWVRGGFYGRRVAPKGTDPASGVPTSVAADRVLVKWRKKHGSKGADDLETWAVHDAATGKVLASADCHRPAIEPGRHPEMTSSFSGRYLVAGSLAFDLKEHKGHCYDESDQPGPGAPGDAAAADPDDPAADHGPRPLTLTTVTDDGIAYGTTAAHSAGGGRPQEVTLATATAEALTPTAHLPAVDVGGYGIFPYTDSADVDHLVGHPRHSPAG